MLDVRAVRKRDPQRRRQEILEAASEIMVQQDSHALTHRAVAAQSGLALGTMTRHFPSIDELREATLQKLSEEVHQTLDLVERELSSGRDFTERCAKMIHEYLLDRRHVRATLTIVNAATSDPRLHSLAMHWSERIVEILSKHVGKDRALAIQVYLDGALIHAALNETPLSEEMITGVIAAILTMSSAEDGDRCPDD